MTRLRMGKYIDVKWLSQHLSYFRFSRRFVLIHVGYLSSSEAYTKIEVSLERKITWLSTGENIFRKY